MSIVFQKIIIFLMDFNDFIQFWGQLGNTLSPFCDPRSSKCSRRAPEPAIRDVISSKTAPELAIRGVINSKTAPESAIRGIISSKNQLESAIKGGRSSKNEATDGYIGKLRRHEGSKSAKYSKTNGKSMKMTLEKRRTDGGRMEERGLPGGMRGPA